MGRASNRKWMNRILGKSRANPENLDQSKLIEQLQKFACQYPHLFKKVSE